MIRINCFFLEWLTDVRYLAIAETTVRGSHHRKHPTRRRQNFNFHTGGPYHIETSPLICRADLRIGYCMIGTCVMKELMNSR